MSAIGTSKNQHVIRHKRYWSKQISNQCWINLINKRFKIPESLQFTKTNLNTALSRNKMYDDIDILTTANALSIYKSSYRPGKIRIIGYYVTTVSSPLIAAPHGNQIHTDVTTVTSFD
jgi:hypothetical protein